MARTAKPDELKTANLYSELLAQYRDKIASGGKLTASEERMRAMITADLASKLELRDVINDGIRESADNETIAMLRQAAENAIAAFLVACNPDVRGGLSGALKVETLDMPAGSPIDVSPIVVRMLVNVRKPKTDKTDSEGDDDDASDAEESES